MGSLLRLHQLMTAEIDRTLKEFDLTRSGYLALSTIQLSENGTRLLSRIATHMIVHPTTVTLLMGKLESQGLVQRVPHPTDRRATQATITPKGTALDRVAGAIQARSRVRGVYFCIFLPNRWNSPMIGLWLERRRWCSCPTS